MRNPHLPQEILIEIFSRIPAKSVGRCRTLSKSWKTNLSTPDFINKHLFTRKQTIQQENLALIKTFTNDLYDSLCIITSPTKSDQLINHIIFPDECYSILGSCNGLILVNSEGCVILINPITRKEVNIPHFLPPKRKDLGYCDRIYGLGYDSFTDDYKIVVICGNGLVQTYVDVYSVKNGVWKTLDDGCYPYNGFVPNQYGFEGGALVKWALHYLVCSAEGYRSCIASFDLITEVFTEIPLPREFVKPAASYRNGVCVVNGCLLIVDNLGEGVSEVWIRKEYGVEESWVKFLIKGEESEMNSINAMLCYVEDGELLFLTSRDSLLTCELKIGTMWNMVLGEPEFRYFHGMAFVDSLVSPE